MEKSEIALVFLTIGGSMIAAGMASPFLHFTQQPIAEDQTPDYGSVDMGNVFDPVNKSDGRIDNHTIKPIGNVEDRIIRHFGQTDNRINRPISSLVTV